MESRSCLMCRKRKVKCDRTAESCHKCHKFGVRCTYSAGAGTDIAHGEGSSPNLPTTQAGLKRRRILRSCKECKHAKSRCSGGDMCQRCMKKNLACLYDCAIPAPQEQMPARQLHSIPAWLTARDLPSADCTRELVDIYFTRIHTVRCLGFLHIPSFMARLEDSAQLHGGNSKLIHVMCALAAPFYYAKTVGAREDAHDSNIRFLEAGRGWAKTAMESVFSSFGNPDIECLMTEVLLHEYFLRVGDHAKGFLISGVIARHTQMLQLNLEYDYDVLCERSKISGAVKETRRRLVWACYLLDAFIECGIDQLRFILFEDVQVQLPCREELFLSNKPCIVEMLSRGKLLPFAYPPLGVSAADNLDMRAFYIRAMAIRSKVLKYVKNLEGEVPWQLREGSRFHALADELQDLEASIPKDVRISSENTYMFKASGRLNLYFGLHILIAQTFNDLYRVGVSQLVFPNSATTWIRQNAPREFIEQCHRTCISKAIYIASLLKDLWNRDKLSMVDLAFAVHAQVCNSVIIASLVSWQGPGALCLEYSNRQFRDMLHTNVLILQYLQRYIKVDLYLESAQQAIRCFDGLFSPDHTEQTGGAQTDAGSSDKEKPPQFSLQYILNPLGVYPLAGNQAHDRHEPETNGTSDYATWEFFNIGNSGLVNVSLSNGCSIINASDMSLIQLPHWGLEIPILEGIGYPNIYNIFEGSSGMPLSYEFSYR